MANLNKVFLIGRLTRDPELRSTPGGASVCDLGLAVNRKWRDQNGEDQEETLFVDVTVWGKTAENCDQYLEKGREVFIEGRLRLDTWENDEGQKRSKMRVVGQFVQFLGGGQRSERRESRDDAQADIPF